MHQIANLNSIPFHRSKELGGAFALQRSLDKSVYLSIGESVLNFKNEHPNATNTEIFIHMQNCLSVAHYGIAPIDMVRGYRRSPKDPRKYQGLENPRYQFQHGQDMMPSFKLSTQTTSGDTPPLVKNPLTSPTYGGSTGIVPPYWLDVMIRATSRACIAKNFAMTFPMTALVDVAPIKTTKPDTKVDDGTIKPVLEARAGVDYTNTYTAHNFDARKLMIHSPLSWETMVALQGKIQVQADILADLAKAHALVIDSEIFEGLYTAMVSGMYRRWESTAYGVSEEIALGAASVLTTNAKKHRLFYDITTGKTYYPSTASGDENKYQQSTRREEYLSPDGSEIYDLIVDMAELQKKKGHKLEFVALSTILTTNLVKDDRMISADKVTGKPQFQNENGYLGQINIGGSAGKVDVWEIPDNSIASKTTADTVSIVGVIIGGEYRQTCIYAPYAPFGIFVDKGFEVVSDTIHGAAVSTLRMNDTQVITSKSVECIAPWDTEAAVIAQVVATAHT